MKHVTWLAIILLCGTAAADNKEKADVLFKQGKKLMSEKRYADACAAFEQSVKLDPGIGGQLNIAKCFEEWGKLGRALHAYQKAEEMARDAKDSRLAKIHELVEGLEPNVPHLTLKVPADADTSEVSITLDGNAVDKADLGQAQLVDPGPHLVEWKSQGKKKTKVVPVERGASSEVTLDIGAKIKPVKEEPKVVKTEPPPKEEPKQEPKDDRPKQYAVDPGRNRRLIAYGVGGAGVVLIGTSTILTVVAKGKYNDALKNDCMNMTNACDPAGLTATHSARSEANVGTVLFIVGAGAVGAGVALYLTAPHGAKLADESALYLAPSVSPDGAGIVLGGTM